MPTLKIGQAATILTDAGQRLPGTITFISPKAEFTPRNVQTADERSKLVYRVKVTADNRDGHPEAGHAGRGGAADDRRRRRRSASTASRGATAP